MILYYPKYFQFSVFGILCDIATPHANFTLSHYRRSLREKPVGKYWITSFELFYEPPGKLNIGICKICRKLKWSLYSTERWRFLLLNIPKLRHVSET